ncbi:MAG: hypothetical protein AB7O55_32950 [Lautropia sp.]
MPYGFLLAAAAMTLLALAVVLVPLLRRPVPAPAAPAASGSSATTVAGRWPAALATAIGLPLTVMIVYALVGHPRALTGATDPHRGVLADPGHSDAAVNVLARRLQTDDNDGQGWMLLARSWLQLSRIPEALAAYGKATALVPDDADLWVEYANTTAIANGRRLAGEPARLVERALQIDPDNLNALALAGMVAFQADDAALALTHWRRLESLVPPGSEDRDRVSEMIARAEGKAAADLPGPGRAAIASAAPGDTPAGPSPTTSTVPAAPTMPAASAVPAARTIRGTVTVAAELAAKVAPTDTLYVFARGVDGPPMPLAAVRTRAREWPVSFMLDDSSAMTEGLMLSRYPRVDVVARVSRLGTPAAQPGDIEGRLENVALGSEVRVVLDRVVGR